MKAALTLTTFDGETLEIEADEPIDQCAKEVYGRMIDSAQIEIERRFPGPPYVTQIKRDVALLKSGH
jgi:hypothetical protein